MNIQLSGLILLKEAKILPFIGRAVDNAGFGQEQTPQIVRIASQERIVQVENSQCQEVCSRFFKRWKSTILPHYRRHGCPHWCEYGTIVEY